MAILNIDHPDIVEFITCKRAGYNLDVDDIAKQYGVSTQEAKRIKSVIGIEKFNISIGITDAFMECLYNYGTWKFYDPHTKEQKGSMPAIDLWNLIVENAYDNGEPGLFFVDTSNRFNSIPHIGRIKACNPCGEQDLIAYMSCTLAHLNLSKFR